MTARGLWRAGGYAQAYPATVPNVVGLHVLLSGSCTRPAVRDQSGCARTSDEVEQAAHEQWEQDRRTGVAPRHQAVRCIDSDLESADEAVDVRLTQIALHRDEQGDRSPVEVSVDAHHRRTVGGCLDRRGTRLKMLLTDSAGNVGVTERVVRREVHLASQVDRLAVVFAEEEPDRVEIVVVGFDAPVPTDLGTEAVAPDAGTTSGDLDLEVNTPVTNRSGDAAIGTCQLHNGHERTLATSNITGRTARSSHRSARGRGGLTIDVVNAATNWVGRAGREIRRFVRWRMGRES